jgi:hypothetical protein
MNSCIGIGIVSAMLPCFAVTHLQDVLRLEHRFGCFRGQVLLMSVGMRWRNMMEKSEK